MIPENYASDTMRIAAATVTPAVLVQRSEDPEDRRVLVVSSELLRQIGHSVSFDPGFTQALDYAATNAPGTLLGVRKRPQGGFISPLLFDGSDLFKYRKSDARVRLAPINESFFRVDRWWPDPARGGAP
jgi:hypothetical protein